MKKLFVILLVTVLTSCVTLLDPPKSNTDYKNIIGKPFKIGNIEVAQYDFPKKMNWNDAEKACADLGEGWKLPSKDELNILYANQNRIGGFANDLYWSSTEFGIDHAWYQGFTIGSQDIYPMSNTFYVRAIRALKQSAALEPDSDGFDRKNIIGKSIKIGNLEIAQYDFPDAMDLEDAKKFCTNLGKGWRLPSKDELNILYQNKVAIGGNANQNNYYWSSTEGDFQAWAQSFYDGDQDGFTKNYPGYVRAVRSF